MKMSVAFGEEEVASLQVQPVLGPLRDVTIQLVEDAAAVFGDARCRFRLLLGTMNISSEARRELKDACIETIENRIS